MRPGFIIRLRIMIKPGTKVRIRYGEHKDWVGTIFIRRDKTAPLDQNYKVQFSNGYVQTFPEDALEIIEPEQ
jgi:hypothetical protein